MNFDEYQQASRITAINPNAETDLIYPTLGLASEAGEVADKIKKMIRDDDGQLTDARRAALSDELGDVLWYLAALASVMSLSFETIATENLAKLKSRAQRNQLHGTGDTR